MNFNHKVTLKKTFLAFITFFSPPSGPIFLFYFICIFTLGLGQKVKDRKLEKKKVHQKYEKREAE